MSRHETFYLIRLGLALCALPLARATVPSCASSPPASLLTASLTPTGTRINHQDREFLTPRAEWLCSGCCYSPLPPIRLAVETFKQKGMEAQGRGWSGAPRQRCRHRIWSSPPDSRPEPMVRDCARTLPVFSPLPPSRQSSCIRIRRHRRLYHSSRLHVILGRSRRTGAIAQRAVPLCGPRP